MITYNSAQIYVTSATTAREQLTRLDAVINALMATMLTAATTENLTEYTLDDGQTKIHCSYNGVAAIEKSIMSLERLKQIYINRLNGRMARLVDGKSMTRYYGNGR